jgi:hypothetical protein
MKTNTFEHLISAEYIMSYLILMISHKIDLIYKYTNNILRRRLRLTNLFGKATELQ